MLHSSPFDGLVVLVLVVPALVVWLVTLVRARRARDPREADGRRKEVDEEGRIAADRSQRRALLALVLATAVAFCVRLLV